MKNYKLFFENLKVIQKKYEILHSNEDNFNIFSILRDESDEVNLHSKFITELMRNKRYGKIFLKRFLEINDLNKDEITEYKITQEYYAGEMGRIDIVIELKTLSGRRIIAIENKIYAGDQNKQLERYFKFMKNRGYSSEKIDIIYLTINGESPSKEGLGCLKEEDILNISYKTEIISWVELCIKEAVLSPVIRETLIQYKKLLEKLTNKGEKNMINELKELILSDEKYLSTAFLIPDALSEIKIDLQYKFWENLESGMEDLKRKFNLRTENNLEYPNLEYNIERVKKYYTASSNKKFYGLMYELKELESGEKLYLRIEIDHNIYWGIRVIDKDGNSNKNLEKKYLSKDLAEFRFKCTDWWLGWKYLYLDTNELETINFNIYNESLCKILMNENRLHELIDCIVSQIKRDLEILKTNNIF